MLRRGWGPASQHLLTVAGRRSGLPRTTPVAVLIVNGQRYLVGGYTGSDWVKNLRRAKQATVTRGSHSEAIQVTELPLDERWPILQRFARDVRGGRAFLTVDADATPDQFDHAARQHPVFLIHPTDTETTA